MYDLPWIEILAAANIVSILVGAHIGRQTRKPGFKDREKHVHIGPCPLPPDFDYGIIVDTPGIDCHLVRVSRLRAKYLKWRHRNCPQPTPNPPTRYNP